MIWHATSQAEAKDIAAEAPKGAEIVVAPNLRLMLTPPAFTPPGEALRVIFVGRIVPIKGLDFALEVLARLQVPAEFEIFGPAEDEATYARCRALAQKLPAHVKATWRGAASNEEIVAALARSDVFLLPTGGENFGHAIFEALSCGVPALISDQTPWRGLAARQRRLGRAAGPAGGVRRRAGGFRGAAARGARALARGRARLRAGLRRRQRRGGGERRTDPAGPAMTPARLAVVVSHPIQYYAPLWRRAGARARTRPARDLRDPRSGSTRPTTWR